MEFRLIYSGVLNSNGTKDDKQLIRKAFHPQLLVLWESDYFSKENKSAYYNPTPIGSFQFIPIVTSKLFLLAELDILMLRPEAPGSIITQGGDIDNRLKTLLDALRIPKDLNEIPSSASPNSNENPFLCLLEDDALITRINVTTDRLLVNNSNKSEVNLTIHVKVRTSKNVIANLDLIG